MHISRHAHIRPCACRTSDAHFFPSLPTTLVPANNHLDTTIHACETQLTHPCHSARHVRQQYLSDASSVRTVTYSYAHVFDLVHKQNGGLAVY
jgi:hypothetical protein